MKCYYLTTTLQNSCNSGLVAAGGRKAGWSGTDPEPNPMGRDDLRTRDQRISTTLVGPPEAVSPLAAPGQVMLYWASL